MLRLLRRAHPEILIGMSGSSSRSVSARAHNPELVGEIERLREPLTSAGAQSLVRRTSIRFVDFVASRGALPWRTALSDEPL
jgi:hypothetical protein